MSFAIIPTGMTSRNINLRGACQCGRNQYAIQIPSASTDLAQIIFDSNTNHRIALASPLSAFLRVPLTWYHSEVFPFFEDEARSTIRRSYVRPDERHAQRSFCGYCGTPLAYWSEQPASEAEYIRLTLGSLLNEDFHSLQDLGLVPDEREDEKVQATPAFVQQSRRGLAGRSITGIPWFESLISGSRLDSMLGQHRGAGNVRIELEVTEWTTDDDKDEGDGDGSESSSSTTGKRKRGLDSENDTIQMSTTPFDA
ncbi:hypothetical protein F5Y17DRAFT_204339 [Xylariaceae sp. FL0594]|nr:hypothetical protein F5Y17DRAFT_204339 [Xylariaceae sp. FL0594]